MHLMKQYVKGMSQLTTNYDVGFTLEAGIEDVAMLPAQLPLVVPAVAYANVYSF